MRRAAVRGPLAHRDFRLVLTAWGLSALGDFLAVVALTLRIQEDTGDVVWYADPSGVFEIDFWHKAVKEDDTAAEKSAGADPEDRKAYYDGIPRSKRYACS